jgi:hypothetical protein
LFCVVLRFVLYSFHHYNCVIAIELEVELRNHCQKIKVLSKPSKAHFIFPSETGLALRVYYPNVQLQIAANLDENADWTHDIDGICDFCHAFLCSAVFFVITDMTVMDQPTSMVCRAMRLVDVPLKPNQRPLRLFVVADTAQALTGLMEMANGMAPARVALRRKFANRVRREHFVGDPSDNNAETAAEAQVHLATHVSQVMIEWAQRQGLPRGDAEILLSATGTLAKLAGVAKSSAVARIPVHDRTKQALFQLFSAPDLDEEDDENNDTSANAELVPSATADQTNESFFPHAAQVPQPAMNAPPMRFGRPPPSMPPPKVSSAWNPGSYGTTAVSQSQHPMSFAEQAPTVRQHVQQMLVSQQQQQQQQQQQLVQQQEQQQMMIQQRRQQQQRMIQEMQQRQRAIQQQPQQRVLQHQQQPLLRQSQQQQWMPQQAQVQFVPQFHPVHHRNVHVSHSIEYIPSAQQAAASYHPPFATTNSPFAPSTYPTLPPHSMNQPAAATASMMSWSQSGPPPGPYLHVPPGYAPGSGTFGTLMPRPGASSDAGARGLAHDSRVVPSGLVQGNPALLPQQQQQQQPPQVWNPGQQPTFAMGSGTPRMYRRAC